MVMTWVKICGVRRSEEIEVAHRSGADAIGLVLAPSPRQVDAETAARLTAESPLPVFLVMVDARPLEALDLATHVGAAGIQPHGRSAAETAAAAVRAGLQVLRPIPVGDDAPVVDLPPGQIPLFDTDRPGLHGGIGAAFDHRLIPAVTGRWVLAGGLGPDNIETVLDQVAPWGVDASSRLESRPGIKDIEAIRAFVTKVKSR